MDKFYPAQYAQAMSLWWGFPPDTSTSTRDRAERLAVEARLTGRAGNVKGCALIVGVGVVVALDPEGG